MTVLLRELELAHRILDLKALHGHNLGDDAENIFHTFFERSPDCMFHIKRAEDGSFVYNAVNSAGLRAAGLSIEQVRGRTPEQVLGPVKGRQMTEGLREACQTRKIFRYEPSWDLPSGTVIYDAGYMPLTDSNDNVTGLFGIARNVTQERRLEAVNHHSAKMDALGQLASGVAHDFNNLLAQQQACLRLLGKQVDSDAAHALITEGIRSVDLGKSLTHRLVTFARQLPLSKELVNPNAAVQRIMPLLIRAAGPRAVIKAELEPDVRDFLGDTNQIESALLNLVLNAHDAMPEQGGTITVRTQNRTLATSYKDLLPGDYVSIEIADTGSGVPAEIIDRVFDPFFTTKLNGQGTGLGLSLVYGMTKQFNGEVEITSNVGTGTVIRLIFPCAKAWPAQVAGQAAYRA